VGTLQSPWLVRWHTLMIPLCAFSAVALPSIIGFLQFQCCIHSVLRWWIFYPTHNSDDESETRRSRRMVYSCICPFILPWLVEVEYLQYILPLFTSTTYTGAIISLPTQGVLDSPRCSCIGLSTRILHGTLMYVTCRFPPV